MVLRACLSAKDRQVVIHAGPAAFNDHGRQS
jgi:hypothetical protein